MRAELPGPSAADAVWTGVGASLVSLFSLVLLRERLGWGWALGMPCVTARAVLLVALEPRST